MKSKRFKEVELTDWQNDWMSRVEKRQEPLRFLIWTTWLMEVSVIQEIGEPFPKVGSKKKKMIMLGRHFSIIVPQWAPQIKYT